MEWFNYPGLELWKFINLAIFTGAGIFVLRKPISQALMARRGAIQQELVAAQQERERALAQVQEADNRLSRLHEDVRALHRQADEEARAERRVARRLPVGELGAVDEREWGTVPAVEQDVEGLHRRDGRVGREHGDELDAEHVAGTPRGQAEEGLAGAVGPEHGPAHDRRGPSVGFLQPVHQLQVRQEPGDVGAVEHRQPAQVGVLAHDRSLADPAAVGRRPAPRS